MASASDAIQGRRNDSGLLRRFAPLHKRCAFVAGNDGYAIQLKVIARYSP